MKDVFKRIKDKPWLEENVSRHTYNKKVLFRICKYLSKLNNKKTNQEMGTVLDKHFIKDKDGKHLKLHSTNYSPSESNWNYSETILYIIRIVKIKNCSY